MVDMLLDYEVGDDHDDDEESMVVMLPSESVVVL